WNFARNLKNRCPQNQRLAELRRSMRPRFLFESANRRPALQLRRRWMAERLAYVMVDLARPIRLARACSYATRNFYAQVRLPREQDSSRKRTREGQSRGPLRFLS